MPGNWKKALQKQAYDIVSHRYGILILIGSIALVTISAFHFGETLLEWSHEKYAAVFNSFSDNIGGKSFRERVCLPLPIDVVYTWVNGSDPNLINALRKVKLDMEEELNITREAKCTFTNCLPTTMVILDPPLPAGMTLKELVEVNSVFGQAQRLFPITSSTEDKWNFTVVLFPEGYNMSTVLNQTLTVNLINISLRKGHITTDWTVPDSILMTDYIIMAGFPSKYTVDQLKEKLPVKMKNGIENMELHSEEGLAVLYVPNKENFNHILETSNLTIDGKEPTLNAANLVWDLRDFRKNEDVSSSRFEDNEELRYSLRSLDRFAPWIRHVFIVTNGQIPYWLNMEHPRLSLVTHEDIFPNKSHLPTFSSPAIEAHLHRIPGLSKRFIYMNDDVMFGKEVWPDDFFTFSGGQKVYLTWPVPNCQDGCPSTWIRDGYCDKACNNSECEWDGGDCDGANPNQQNHWQGGVNWLDDRANDYCTKGCPNTWLSDRYCDAACNVKECGFDTADCGTSNYDLLYGVHLNKTEYILPKGETIVYFNLTSLITSEGAIESASYNKSSAVRVASVGNKFKVMTVIFYPNKNISTTRFTLKGHTGNSSQKIEFKFTVTAETQVVKKEISSMKVNQTISATENATSASNDTVEEILVIEEIPQDLWYPKAKLDNTYPTEPVPVNLSSAILPEALAKEFNQSLKMFQDGELTEKGFKIQEMIIWQKFRLYRGKSNPLFGNRKLLGLTKSSVVMETDKNGQLTEYEMESDVIKVNEENELTKYHEDDTDLAESQRQELWENIQSQHPVHTEHEFPWEKQGTFSKLVKARDKMNELSIKSYHSRKLLDTFGDSLRHVNKLYNKAFGFVARKVPAHMPHMIDKDIMDDLQDLFPEAWEVTSSHKVRSSNDMQFAFAYFYYMMGVKRNITVEDVFDQIDTDKSRVLSDREIRTLATKLYELPLDLQTLTGLESVFKNCSKHLPEGLQEEVPESAIEKYYEDDMPQVTKALFMNCDAVSGLVHKNFKHVQKYSHTIMEEDEVAFKMIKSNISTVVGQLDDIRKHPKKFICLNDNIDHVKEDAKTVKAILQDFYEAVFPLDSQFELQRDYRNRFLHMDELREWRQYRDWLKFWTHLALAILVIFTVASFFADKIEAAQRRMFRRRVRSPQSSTSPASDEDTSSTSQSTGLIQTV